MNFRALQVRPVRMENKDLQWVPNFIDEILEYICCRSSATCRDTYQYLWLFQMIEIINPPRHADQVHDKPRRGWQSPDKAGGHKCFAITLLWTSSSEKLPCGQNYINLHINERGNSTAVWSVCKAYSWNLCWARYYKSTGHLNETLSMKVINNEINF